MQTFPVRRCVHSIAFAFILATYYELIWQRVFFPPYSPGASLVATTIDAPAILVERLIPHSWKSLAFGWSATYWDFFFWKGGWVQVLPDMTAYILVFQIPWLLRKSAIPGQTSGPKAAENWRYRLSRVAGRAASWWDWLMGQRPRFLVSAVLRLAYAYLASFAIVVFRDVNLTAVHDYFTYGLQGLLDLPLTCIGLLLPFADRGFDFWLTTAVAPPANFSDAYLTHMAMGTTTYFCLSHLPSAYRRIRRIFPAISAKLGPRKDELSEPTVPGPNPSPSQVAKVDH